MTEQEWLSSSDPAAMLRLFNSGVPVQASTFRLSDRKLRLFACACCRQVWHLLTDERSRKAVEAMEAEVDGASDEGGQLSAAVMRGRDVPRDFGELYHTRTLTDPERAQWNAADMVATLADDVSPGWPQLGQQFFHSYCRALASEKGTDAPTWGTPLSPMPALATLLREIVGSPWRRYLVAEWAMNPEAFGFTYVFDKRWLTPTVLALAEAAYRERGRQAPSGPFPGIGATTTWVDDGTLDPVRLGILADALEDAGCDSEDVLRHLRGPGPHVRGCWAVDLLLGKD